MNKLVCKSIIYLLIVLLIFSSINSRLAGQAEAASRELGLKMGQEGKDPSSKASISVSEDSLAPPGNPIVDSKGSLTILRDDFLLPGDELFISVHRLYRTEFKDKLSPFGYGWKFPYDHYIQIFADFQMGEFRPDGSLIAYDYHKDDEMLMVDEYDGDPVTYYPLHRGHYSPGQDKSMLERISGQEYRVTAPSGIILIFKGYRAPWRKNAHPAAGKLIAIEDGKGNRLGFIYDSEGRLVEVISPDKRSVTFQYSGQLVTSMKDPNGRMTTYAYENKELKTVKHPDGTTESFTYDSDHKLLSITDSKTGKKQFSYEGNRVSHITHDDMLLSRYDYADGKVIATDGDGHTTIYDEHLNNITESAYGEAFRLGRNLVYWSIKTGVEILRTLL